MSEITKSQWDDHLYECYKLIEQMQIIDIWIMDNFSNKMIKNYIFMFVKEQ